MYFFTHSIGVDAIHIEKKTKTIWPSVVASIWLGLKHWEYQKCLYHELHGCSLLVKCIRNQYLYQSVTIYIYHVMYPRQHYRIPVAQTHTYGFYSIRISIYHQSLLAFSCYIRAGKVVSLVPWNLGSESVASHGFNNSEHIIGFDNIMQVGESQLITHVIYIPT